MPNWMRWLRDVTEYENEWQPTLHNPKITVSFWGDILRWFDWRWRYKDEISNKINFWDLDILEINNSTLILEFQTKADKNDTMSTLEEKIEMKNTFMSKELENWRQIPWISGYFERDWKFYLIVRSYLRNTDETDVDKWIYKWNIINPKAYYEGDEVIWWITDSFESEVEDNIREK